MSKTAIQDSLNYLLALKAALVKFPRYQKHVRNLEKVIKEVTKFLEENGNKREKTPNRGEKNKRKSKVNLEKLAKKVLHWLKVILDDFGFPFFS